MELDHRTTVMPTDFYFFSLRFTTLPLTITTSSPSATRRSFSAINSFRRALSFGVRSWVTKIFLNCVSLRLLALSKSYFFDCSLWRITIKARDLFRRVDLGIFFPIRITFEIFKLHWRYVCNLFHCFPILKFPLCCYARIRFLKFKNYHVCLPRFFVFSSFIASFSFSWIIPLYLYSKSDTAPFITFNSCAHLVISAVSTSFASIAVSNSTSDAFNSFFIPLSSPSHFPSLSRIFFQFIFDHTARCSYPEYCR